VAISVPLALLSGNDSMSSLLIHRFAHVVAFACQVALVNDTTKVTD